MRVMEQRGERGGAARLDHELHALERKAHRVRSARRRSPSRRRARARARWRTSARRAPSSAARRRSFSAPRSSRARRAPATARNRRRPRARRRRSRSRVDPVRGDCRAAHQSAAADAARRSRRDSPASSSSSSAAVPAPATMRGSSNGGTSVASRSRPRDSARSLRDARARARKARPPRRNSRVAASLTGRRIGRHHDRRGDPEQTCAAKRDALRVVAARERDDAARALLRRKRREKVIRAAKLERAHALQVLALDEDARAGQRSSSVRERTTGVRWAMPSQPLRRRADVGEVYRGSGQRQPEPCGTIPAATLPFSSKRIRST